MKSKTILKNLIIGSLLQFIVYTTAAQTPGAAPPATNAGPGQIIPERIRAEVAARLTEAGATCDELVVTQAMKRDSATPFTVTYSGLRNFQGPDGTVPEANGQFGMNYIGAGKWQGALAGKQFTAQVGTVDNIDLPFVDDPAARGEWESVDFVADIDAFDPAQRAWSGNLYLKGLTFLENGKMPQSWWTWTKGYVMHRGDRTASRYEIRDIGGTAYLFFEWKSGDVTIAGMKPHYYVLKKKS